MTLKLSDRSFLPPFMVLEVMEEAATLESKGADILRLELGQPSSAAPKAASDALIKALSTPASHGYALPLGTDSLRRAIADHYRRFYGQDVKAEQVMVTVGSSVAFALTFLACFDPGARIAVSSPGYAAYPNLMAATGIEAVTLPARAEQNWLPQLADIKALDPKPDGILLASPSNPTGSVLSHDELSAIAHWCEENDVRFISDEIYHGITYGVEATTALEFSSSAIIINSFSKYFSMTGYRVGWLVLPPELVENFDKISQNLVISVPTLSQIAAEEAISNPAAIAELDSHVHRYRENRDILLNSLPPQFLGNCPFPKGGFYIYADTSGISDDSVELAQRLLHEAGVATTPGADFDEEEGHLAVRLSFAGSSEEMREAAQRITSWVKNNT